jgi:hypothetical protein
MPHAAGAPIGTFSNAPSSVAAVDAARERPASGRKSSRCNFFRRRVEKNACVATLLGNAALKVPREGIESPSVVDNVAFASIANTSLVDNFALAWQKITRSVDNNAFRPVVNRRPSDSRSIVA